MKAKLIRTIPAPPHREWFFTKYEFECIDCGAHYKSGACTSRTSPYCAACYRKHEKEKQKMRNAERQSRIINSALSEIKAEIMAIGNWRTKSEIPNGYLVQAIEILDKHIEGCRKEQNDG